MQQRDRYAYLKNRVRYKDRWIDRYMDRQIDRWINRQIDRQEGRIVDSFKNRYQVDICNKRLKKRYVYE